MNKRPDVLGNDWQLGGIQRLCLEEGKGKGTSLIRVRNGKGLDFTIVPDRGMDVFDVQYRGVQLAWISSNGLVSNTQYDPVGLGWLRTFGGGMLCTCGLRHVGPPVDDEGEHFGLHGRISLIPAQQVSTNEYWENGVLYMEVRAQMRESNVFGENLVLERTYLVNSASDTIELNDRILNQGSKKEQIMILYHLNWGHPLLSADTKLRIDHSALKIKVGEASEEALWNQFTDPQPGITERVYHFDPQADIGGKAAYSLENPVLGKGVRVSWDKAVLPVLAEWKMMAAGEYVLGLEPCNTLPIGRINSRESGSDEFLEPGAAKDISMQITFYPVG